ncbi:MAG: 5-formyltetrahydrofolate cyclo-ligase, partial [Patescibacteria group bacterium]
GDEIQFDLIIVPMLAYDPVTKHRLGFGGGFYDRLLASQPEAVSVGVCFKEFAVENLPVEPTDIALDEIIAM